MTRQSSLLIAVPAVEHLVANWRAAHDPGVDYNIDCHITVLFPFVPADEIDGRLIAELTGLVTGFGEFEFDLTGISEFPGVLWLRPEPTTDLIRLMTLVRGAYPEYPAYGGEHLEPNPHLTVAMTTGEQQHQSLKHQITANLAPLLPVRCNARDLGLYTSDGAGRWSRLTSFPLAV